MTSSLSVPHLIHKVYYPLSSSVSTEEPLMLLKETQLSFVYGLDIFVNAPNIPAVALIQGVYHFHNN